MSNPNSDISSSKFLVGLGCFTKRHPVLMRKLGNLETRVLASQFELPDIHQPVFITALARAGTTILLEMLAQHPHAVSHRYRDFPLLDIPYWWNWFLDVSSRKKIEPVERYHKDRIKITYDSPEAMEEILWMSAFPETHNPDVSNLLGTQTDYPEFERYLKDHIRKLLYLRGGKRYICKGNYNFLRLPYLHKLFPDARFIIPVRQPENHIASLHKQHQLLCNREQADSGALTYMQLAGHFEFGLDRRPANINNAEAVKLIQQYWKKGQELSGWALYWSELYSFLANQLEQDTALREHTCVVHYEQLCSDSRTELKRIYDHSCLEMPDTEINRQAAGLSLPEYYKSGFTDSQVREIRRITDTAFTRILSLI